MFEPTEIPRLFALPCGVDFGAEVVRGLQDRMRLSQPEDMARVELIVNTLRMQRRITAAFDASPASFLPKIRLITSLVPEEASAQEQPSALAHRLGLVALVRPFLEAQRDFAPSSSAFDLADSVAGLMAEMEEEGVSLEALSNLTVSEQSKHWDRALSFLQIVLQYAEQNSTGPTARDTIDTLLRDWETSPPQHPIIIAGSTGSRSPAHRLMQAVARLPQGAVILPGVDTEMPRHGWRALASSKIQEDHPQHRILALSRDLGLEVTDLPTWTHTAAPSPARNALASLALRPAPVTHAWLKEGPHLQALDQALEDVTLVEAQTLRDEALAIALRLRKAADEGTSTALISPDRTLTRLVTAMLDQWGILPDDSAGIPLHLTAPGRFLRHVADLRSDRITAEKLLIVLKHPLCHSVAGRNEHLRHTRDLELHLRAEGPPFPDARMILEFSQAIGAPDWGEWLVACLFADAPEDGARPLAQQLLGHRGAAERLAAGIAAEGTGGLWEQLPGMAARRAMDGFAEAAPKGPDVTAQEYLALFQAILSREQQRDRDAGHPHIRIWGTLEARVMDAELLILGGLNEGSWPEAPAPDPWLNRAMRKEAGLLLPERRIGLSAHDFQQALGAKTVWLTRALRSDGAETVPSRWLNRLTNLLGGLPETGAPALKAARRRGAYWMALGQQFEAVARIAPAYRPSPRPPLDARPKKLSVTQIKTLVRDPYAIYARQTLGLRPLEPLAKTADAAMRGITVHRALEAFIEDGEISQEAFLRTTAATLAEDVPWPEMRVLWQARLKRISEQFIADERLRQSEGHPVEFEPAGRSTIPHLDFTLTAKADRIDLQSDGRIALYDYKTGHVPTHAEQRRFDKQLQLMAAMAEAGAFEKLPATPVAKAEYLGLGLSPKIVSAPFGDGGPAQTWAELMDLIEAMQSPGFGFTSRRAMQRDNDPGTYDHLARFGEWDTTRNVTPEDLT
ncbi:double-strand break repair protein AddB [Primorskyibacter sp. S187A]|uniref:double-strand break repair protein AddB n=1 Tax=Primorskyibacter sp. S187A TaxID=3415130 RepID=UPI003C7AF67D